MTNKQIKEIKKQAQSILLTRMGMAPAIDKIVLLECEHDGSYIKFFIQGNVNFEYEYSKYNYNTLVINKTTMEGDILESFIWKCLE